MSDLLKRTRVGTHLPFDGGVVRADVDGNKYVEPYPVAPVDRRCHATETALTIFTFLLVLAAVALVVASVVDAYAP